MIKTKTRFLGVLISTLFISLSATHALRAADANYGKNKFLQISVNGYSGLAGYKAFVSTERNASGLNEIFYFHNYNHKDDDAYPNPKLSDSNPAIPYYFFGKWMTDMLAEGKTIDLFTYKGKKIFMLTGVKFDLKVGGNANLEFISNFITSRKERIVIYMQYNPATDGYDTFYYQGTSKILFKRANVVISTTLGIPTGIKSVSFDGKKTYNY